jgi:8-oxo-dGTP pyrophosphatase MutT (NUDIX family)
VDAARREFYEETGVLLPLIHFTYLTTLQLAYVAPIFTVKATKDQFSLLAYNHWEIVALQWFSLDSLPSAISPSIEQALRVLSKQR